MSKRKDKLFLSDGSIEALKWFGLLLMTLDHVNKYLMGSSSTILFSLGRLALPVFVFVLVYNLSRDSKRTDHYLRAIKRMVFFGLLATPAFILMDGSISLIISEGVRWHVLNILFTLALLTWRLYAFERGKSKKWWLWVGWGSFWLLGAFVEFYWSALLLGFCVWRYYNNASLNILILYSLFCLGLLFIVNNGNAYFLGAFLVIYLMSKVRVTFPRIKWIFYCYYPLHLTAIYAVKKLI